MKMRFLPPEIDKTLFENDEKKPGWGAKHGEDTHENDEQIHYLRWIACDVQDERICD